MNKGLFVYQELSENFLTHRANSESAIATCSFVFRCSFQINFNLNLPSNGGSASNFKN